MWWASGSHMKMGAAQQQPVILVTAISTNSATLLHYSLLASCPTTVVVLRERDRDREKESREWRVQWSDPGVCPSVIQQATCELSTFINSLLFCLWYHLLLLQAAASSSRAQLCLSWVSCDLLQLIITELCLQVCHRQRLLQLLALCFSFFLFFPALVMLAA